MNPFIFYINEAQTHSTHLVDLFILKRKEGLQKILLGLDHISKTLGLENPPISVKIDGAPAIAFGWAVNQEGFIKSNPLSFFVGTKSLFSKNPKAYFSEKDINDAELPGGLKEVLKIGWKYLQTITPKGKDVYQGDFLFIKSRLKSETIDGIDYITFHPNTIKYGIAKSDPLYKDVVSAQMGIAVHTHLEIGNFNDLTTIKHKGFGVKKETFKSSKDIFLIDTYPKNVSKDVAFTSSEKSNYKKLITNIKTGLKIDYSILDEPKTKKYFLTFTNFYIKQGKILSPNEILKLFIKFIDEKDSTKNKENAFEFIKSNEQVYLKVFEIYSDLMAITNMLVTKFNKIANMSTFIQKSNGDIQTTDHEGFVMTGLGLEGVKLVNRYSFSYNNFSSEIIKGIERN